MPSAAARSKIETISAPLWLTSPMAPSGSRSVSSTTDEQSASRWWGTISPMQLGPTSRMPDSRAIATSSAWRAAPSAPASAKPVEMMTQQPTPAAAASRTVATSEEPGTARMATSGGAGAAAIVG